MAEKTEQPTEKKRRDAAKKGQSWKAQDAVVLLVLLAGASFVNAFFPPSHAFSLFEYGLTRHREIALAEFAKEAMGVFIKWAALTLLAVLVPAILSSLLLSRFRLATQAIKIDFQAINPVSGFKKIWSLRNAKNAVKALLYAAAFAAAVWSFWESHKRMLLASAQTNFVGVIHLWGTLAWHLTLNCLGAVFCLAVADALTEYALYIKDLKMTKDEVKREMKELDGNPEVKGKRRELAHELLESTQRAEVAKSSFVLANPTHIAIGIYINGEITDWPFVSFIHTNARAKAAVAYAKKIGVPVVRDKVLARGIYRTTKRFSFIDASWLSHITEVLNWLIETEVAARPELREQIDAAAQDKAATGAQDAADDA